MEILIVLICILDLFYEIYISVQLMTHKEPEKDENWPKLDKETIKMLKEINYD